jgi:hypothetical protein
MRLAVCCRDVQGGMLVTIPLAVAVVAALGCGGQERGNITRAQYDKIKIGAYSGRVRTLLGPPLRSKDISGGGFYFAYKMPGHVLDVTGGKARRHNVTLVCAFIFNGKSKLTRKPCGILK